MFIQDSVFSRDNMVYLTSMPNMVLGQYENAYSYLLEGSRYCDDLLDSTSEALHIVIPVQDLEYIGNIR